MKNEIVLYYPNELANASQNEAMHIEVTFDEDTAWLTQAQIAELFQRDKSTISRYINTIFCEGELDKNVAVAKYATTTQHGASLKELGKKWFAFTKMDKDSVASIINAISGLIK